MIPASVSDYRELARRRLPRLLFDYIDGGSYAEATLRRNVEEFEAIALRQWVLRDVSTISLETELFGQAMSMPVALGPIGMAGMYARRGEVQAAKAAHAAGVPFTLSTVGICDLAEVVGGAGVEGERLGAGGDETREDRLDLGRLGRDRPCAHQRSNERVRRIITFEGAQRGRGAPREPLQV